MFGERHDLHHEFPEHAELIHRLLGSDQEFAALYKQYDDLDAEILDLEQKGEPVSDEVAEEMKYRRVQLKDKLYAMLKSHAG
ncbi:YdcH family protein [Thiosocius teredinicola]|uniref:YdcH family protein n=1 Tax=Thiosocius teredinicola TaxID=1973002 RepID=UPI000990EE5B